MASNVGILISASIGAVCVVSILVGVSVWIYKRHCQVHLTNEKEGRQGEQSEKDAEGGKESVEMEETELARGMSEKEITKVTFKDL